MRKGLLITASVLLPVSTLSTIAFSSCSKYNGFAVQTNFSKNEAELTNKYAIIKTDYKTDVTIKKGLKVRNIEVVVDDIPLQLNADYVYKKISDDKFNLTVNGKKIYLAKMQVNIYFESFNATFFTNDGETAIANTKVNIDEDFETKIFIKSWSQVSHYQISTSFGVLYEKYDYEYLIEGRVIYLKVFKKSLNCSNLSISVYTAPVQYTVNLQFNDFKEFNHSSDIATINQNFDIDISWKAENLKFYPISISNSVRQFVEQVDYTCEWFHSNLIIHIKKEANVVSDLTIKINASQSEIRPVNISAYKITYPADTAGRPTPTISNYFTDVDVEGANAIWIPNYIECIANSAFNDKIKEEKFENVKLLYFPEDTKIKTIENSAFSGCSDFTGTLNIPASLDTLGESAFSGCEGLEIVKFPDWEKKAPKPFVINKSTFANCSNVKQFIFEGNNDNVTIEESAFEGCKALESFNLPTNTKIIKSRTFYECSSLYQTKLTLPDGLETIEKEAFAKCNSFTSLPNFPSSIKEIGDSAFESCEKLETISNWPSSISEIKFRTFAECTKLFSVSITNKLTDIGNEAFSGCASLIAFPFGIGGIKKIGDSAFSKSGLSDNIELHQSIDDIGIKAFFNCQNIKKVSFGKNTNLKVGNCAFGECPNLKEIDLSGFTSIPGFLQGSPAESDQIFRSVPNGGTIYLAKSIQDAQITEWKTTLQKNGIPTDWNYVKK